MFHECLVFAAKIEYFYNAWAQPVVFLAKITMFYIHNVCFINAWFFKSCINPNNFFGKAWFFQATPNSLINTYTTVLHLTNKRSTSFHCLRLSSCMESNQLSNFRASDLNLNFHWSFLLQQIICSYRKTINSITDVLYLKVCHFSIYVSVEQSGKRCKIIERSNWWQCLSSIFKRNQRILKKLWL